MAYIGIRPAGISNAAEVEVTGDLTVDTNTLYVDSANNRVGVGTTSPASAAGNALVVHDTSAPRIRLTSNTTGEAATDGAEISLLTSAFVVENREASDTIFFNNGAERMRVLSGGGLTFNGDTAAANALDDYEEGTWTPSYGGGLSASSYNQQDGRYTKIGNLVHVQFTIDASASTTNASDVQITGFPFSTHAGQPRAGMSFGVNNNWAPDDTMALMNQNNTNMVFLQHNGSALLGTELTTPNAMITITGTYIAA